MEPEFSADALPIGFHCFGGDAQGGGDLLDVLALGETSEDLLLPGRQGLLAPAPLAHQIFRHRRRHRSTEGRFPRRHGPDRPGELLGITVLQEVARAPRIEHLPHHKGIGVHGEPQDPCFGELLRDAPSGLDASVTSHGHVQ